MSILQKQGHVEVQTSLKILKKSSSRSDPSLFRRAKSLQRALTISFGVWSNFQFVSPSFDTKFREIAEAARKNCTCAGRGLAWPRRCWSYDVWMESVISARRRSSDLAALSTRCDADEPRPRCSSSETPFCSIVCSSSRSSRPPVF